jgi:voltage-gated potassium channel Kch
MASALRCSTSTQTRSILRRFGLKVFYGDAGRLDLLHSAGAHEAKLLLLAIDDPEKANEIAREIRHHYPHLKILARAEGLLHSYELMHIGHKESYFALARERVDELEALLQDDERDFAEGQDHAWDAPPPLKEGSGST